MKIYVASSWRNSRQPSVVEALRAAGHDVYDFKNPKPGNTGFNWREIDPNWQSWTASQFIAALQHPIARGGFDLDAEQVEGCSWCVLVLPCGRSAHLEAGVAVGNYSKLAILLPVDERVEPELMYAWASWIGCDTAELVAAIENDEAKRDQ